MIKNFYKVVAARMEVMETEILEEANRGGIREALQFIEEHPHEEAMWILMPMVFE